MGIGGWGWEGGGEEERPGRGIGGAGEGGMNRVLTSSPVSCWAICRRGVPRMGTEMIPGYDFV